MKKIILFAFLTVCLCLCSCKNEQKSVEKQPVKKPQVKLEDNKEMKENKRLIADTLGIEDDHKLIPIQHALVTVNAGKIRKAVQRKNDRDVYLDVVAEDGRNLRILLSKDYSLIAVKNLDTGEWLITSQM